MASVLSVWLVFIEPSLLRGPPQASVLAPSLEQEQSDLHPRLQEVT